MTILLELACQMNLKSKIYGSEPGKELDEMVEEYIKPALINCNLLMSLINDILNFTREDFDQC